LFDHDVDAKQTASGVVALTAPASAPSISRDELNEGSRSPIFPIEPQTDSDRTRIMFRPSLVVRLGAIARKLLEVVDMIQRSSSTELTQFTEIWKIQWHFEATMFIENRLEMQDINTWYNIAACNRSFSICALLPFLSPPPPHPAHTLISPQHLLCRCQRRASSRTVVPSRSPVHRDASVVEVCACT
jgi:hypothetical protein